MKKSQGAATGMVTGMSKQLKLVRELSVQKNLFLN
jgi:hypothetical protein